MKKKQLIFLLLFLVCGGMFFLNWKGRGLKLPEQDTPQSSSLSNLKKVPDRQQVALQIGSQVLSVEVVNSDQSRSLGLSGRNEIGSDGMLFVFPQTSYQQFWMKDMKFPLDFIWIQDGKVVEVMRQIPFPKEHESLSQLPRYIPSKPINMMLEVESGKADEWQIQEGTSVTLQ